MHNKNNNKPHTFIQGLRPFSSSIPKTLKKHLKKGGYNYSSIVDNWTKMVSNKISNACYPITIKMEKGMKDGTLVLNVIHGKEMEVEYAKNEIIDKINNSKIKCITSSKDRYKRFLATCYKDKINLNKWMVRNGNAVAYKRYSKDYVRDEAYAKENKLGVWEGSFMMPEKWRKLN